MPVSTAQLSILLDLLDKLLDLPPAERAAWLESLARTAPARAAELSALLAEEPRLDDIGFLTGGPGEAASLAGMRLGGYTLERPLGQGGMGTVWLARRSDGRFEGTAAVKLLNLALLDAVGTERFRREGTVLARLSHPNIARLLDAGVSPGGQPYLVLEHVEGERIDTYADARRLSVEARVRLFLDVLDAVAHAHANLIVHRDLKPSNILVTRDGTVKLLDFGIAKLLEGTEESVALTGTGLRELTPEFAAPEQVDGGPVTTGTDVYALGVLLYLLLAGRHPTAPGAGAGAAEYLRAVVDTVPPRLSAAVRAEVAPQRGESAERLRRRCTGDLDNIVAKALKKRAEERYPGVGPLADDLRRHLEHQPVSARGDSFGYRAGKFLRRYRAPVTAAAVAIAALVTAVFVSWRQTAAATRQRDEARFQATRAEAVGEFQTAMISQLGASRLSLAELLDRSSGALTRHPPDDPRVHVELLKQFSDRYGELELRDKQRALLDRADSVATRAGDARLRAALACDLARYHAGLRQDDSAAAALRQGQVLLAGLSRADPEAEVACLPVAAALVALAGHPDSAVALIHLAMARLDSLGAGHSIRYYMTQTSLSTYLRRLRRPHEAVEVDRALRAGLARHGLDGSVLSASVNNNLAIALFEAGERREGIAILREVLEQTRQADPEAEVHPVVGFNYASELATMGEPDSALVWYRAVASTAAARSLQQLERRAMVGVARASAHLGRPAEARRAFARVLALADKQGKAFPRESLFVTASIALAEGDTLGAVAGFEAVLRADGLAQGTQFLGSRAPLADLAVIELARGRPARALEHARALRELVKADSLTEVRSADVGRARLFSARAFAMMGAADSARAHARAAVTALTVGLGPDHLWTREARALVDSLGAPLPAGASPPAASASASKFRSH
ncbi:MAG TPA: protein kinase [Gemmatimonadales bacterium]|nr:protein kinase [Gemmatimonadales bacterium]